ncbi:MAG: Txe/YoeB family addiction module toxin [Saprospiraceae bacterium]|nr:Txe/YoeB family addiction module toxin [Saprospiraceae bacterium]
MARSILFSPTAFEEYLQWRKLDDETIDRINQLILDILREPFKGIGKPEPLKGNYKGLWSRRITQTHRLVYPVKGDVIEIVKCYGHYDD